MSLASEKICAMWLTMALTGLRPARLAPPPLGLGFRFHGLRSTRASVSDPPIDTGARTSGALAKRCIHQS